MASGKNHKACVQNESNFTELASLEYTPEMHVKMCKKIAQLTKVIYALNQKNDEYEVSIQGMKEAHKDEIDLLSTEPRGKCLQCKTKVEEEETLRLKIQNLEEALEKANMFQEQTLADFAMYKKQTEERELKTKSEHDERVSALSKEMLSLKSDFENQLHKLTEEADGLRKMCEGYKNDKQTEQVNGKLDKEVHILNKEVESLKTQNKILTEEYTRKVSKLHSSYSRERENLRKALQQSLTEMIQQLQHKEQEQKKSLQAKEEAMLREVNQLKRDIEAKTQEHLQIKTDSEKMKEKIQVLETQLEEKRHIVMESKAKQALVEEELAVAKEKHLLQENEIHNLIEKMKMMSNENTSVNKLADLKSQCNEQEQKTTIQTCTNEKDNEDVLNSQQDESSENNVKWLNNELESNKIEISRLEMENSVLKDSLALLNKDMSILKQTASSLKESRISDAPKLKQKMESDGVTQSQRQEIHCMVSNFSNAQTLLQTKIVSLEAELKEMEEKSRKQPRPEDLKLIHCLKDKLADQDQVIKRLLELKHCNTEEDTLIHSETHRSQSFSCNPNAASLTSTVKKKKMCEIPSRVISVPNLAAYEKTFTNRSIIPEKVTKTLRNCPRLDPSVKHGYPFKPPAQLLDIIRPNRRNQGDISTKSDAKDQESKKPEWFTKYFSF
ncbi:protein FAM184B isoform X2 [Spea bombifrons]|uniref:protein FAM184B isoform X2 n=1 Tax=Spea bombifrons TaxID=233779 RepID=UPI00234AC4E3|nr:protein FAM184B isoform X2 [Spea bombifrons]